MDTFAWRRKSLWSCSVHKLDQPSIYVNEAQIRSKQLQTENYKTQDNRNQLFAIREIPSLFGNVWRKTDTSNEKVFRTCSGFYGIFNIKFKEFARWKRASEYKLKTKQQKKKLMQSKNFQLQLRKMPEVRRTIVFRAQNSFICISAPLLKERKGNKPLGNGPFCKCKHAANPKCRANRGLLC